MNVRYKQEIFLSRFIQYRFSILFQLLSLRMRLWMRRREKRTQETQARRQT